MPAPGEGAHLSGHPLVAHPLRLAAIDGGPVARCLAGRWNVLLPAAMASKVTTTLGGAGAMAAVPVDAGTLEQLGVGAGGVVVVRPDLYVAAAAPDAGAAGELLAALSPWFAPSRDPATSLSRSDQSHPPHPSSR